MEFVKYFQKQTDRSYRCTIPVKKLDDNDVEHEQECGDTISVSKDSYFINLKRHIMRKHDSRGALMHGLQGAEAQGPTRERGPTGCREIIFL